MPPFLTFFILSSVPSLSVYLLRPFFSSSLFLLLSSISLVHLFSLFIYSPLPSSHLPIFPSSHLSISPPPCYCTFFHYYLCLCDSHHICIFSLLFMCVMPSFSSILSFPFSCPFISLTVSLFLFLSSLCCSPRLPQGTQYIHPAIFYAHTLLIFWTLAKSL